MIRFRGSLAALVAIFVLLLPAFVFGTQAFAAEVEQDDCQQGFIVNAEGTGCIEANDENDPNACRSFGTADAIEQCLAEQRLNDFDLDLKEFSAATAVRQDPCVAGQDYAESVLGIPVWYKYLDVKKDVFIFEDGSETDGKCTPRVERNEQGDIDAFSVLPIGLAVLEAMMTLAGVVAVGMVIWGAFQFVLTQGEPDKAASARKTVINAAIGLVIIIIATSVVSFIATRLTS